MRPGRKKVTIGAPGAKEEKYFLAVAKFPGSRRRTRFESYRRLRRIGACGRHLPGQQRPVASIAPITINIAGSVIPCVWTSGPVQPSPADRKSTRLNSSHVSE